MVQGGVARGNCTPGLPAEVQALLVTIHEAVLEAFTVPQRDRYQMVNSHPAHEIVALDTGLGIARSSRLVIVHVVSRRRTCPQKQRFYELLASKLEEQCGLDPADLVVSITTMRTGHSATGGHSSLPASCRARSCGTAATP